MLQDLDLTIPCGRITALAGPSGVGKSTTVDLLAGLYLPLAGQICVDGVELRELDLQSWRHLLGYVPQEVTLFHDTVFRNVSLWEDDASEEEVIAALEVAGAWSFVGELPQGVQRLCMEKRLTVLAISHQPAWQRIADRVYTMIDGRAVQTHPPLVSLASAG